MSRTLAVLAALGLAIGAAGRTDAGPIFTYKFITIFPESGPALSGSFQVDSSDINATGDTDISNFITNLQFTVAQFTFTAPNFHPEGVTVDSAGDLTTGAGLNQFGGTDTQSGFAIQLDTGGMIGQQYLVTAVRSGQVGAQGSGDWTLFRAQPSPVPEPSAFILAGIGGLGLMAVFHRRRRN
jgi:hypothetical protein